jgi:hypothetical protein
MPAAGEGDREIRLFSSTALIPHHDLMMPSVATDWKKKEDPNPNSVLMN